jgi:hypothetical protein
MAPSTWRTKTAVGVSSVKFGCGCRNDRDAETLEHVMSGELHGEVTGETIGRLNDDRLCLVRCQATQHLGKTRALIDGIGTTHGSIVVLIYDGEPGMFGECVDGGSLPLIAILVSSGICCALGPKIGNC